ncbi:peptidylprolyl isomerase [Segetibacter sp. 3557_3]|uniref:peptidylprolyl isomerase n=1 Tax=Segetibacter sp. 3557_3 TaxID=2547429 RepID=UPI0010591956|nr:peptidylprolyl isomerase [Segetibacter sp. 3557_3]TDH23990.1 peptidylprolyl isomerase [Segetibacter sp. 3557_3]
MKYIFSLFILLSALTITAVAQPKRVIADKIVAQVGDKIILLSDITNSIADIQRQGGQLPPEPECALIEAQLIQKALVLQAEKDSLVVSDDELEASLENQIRGFINQYGSKEILEEVAGKSVYQLKEDFRDPFRERSLADQMRKKIIDNIKITPTEVKTYFETIPKDSLPYYESELEVSEILVYPKSNRDVESYVTRELNDFKRDVEAGTKKFEVLARQYTEDPGSKESGGQYNINRNDKIWDPTFLSAAFKLKEGQISPVIKSKFGLHIIQMVSRAGDDAIIRHILRIPPVTDVEVKEAIEKMDSVRSKLAAGAMSFGEAVSKFSEDEGSKFNAGQKQNREGSTYITIDQLDKDLVIALKDMKVGDYSQPLAFTDERNRKAVRIVHLKSRTEPHRESLKDDYNKIAQRALDEKRSNTLEKWFASHIPGYYIQIDKDFTNCSTIKEWVSKAVVSK